jgi:3-deoxy-D-manno-octulosonate 8-phosphate phosphatase (KDO 8-P phosphatase)
MPAPAPGDSLDRIRLLVLDVDGVMTDGGIHLDDHGIETKRFHVRDGSGITFWKKLGYEAAIITGRRGMVVRHRANELGIEHVIQGRFHKAPALRELLASLKLDAAEAAMIGDDLPDLPAMKMVGYPMAVADAVAEVKAAAAHVTSSPGGHGAVREAIEHLLKAKRRWHEALALVESPPPAG